MARNLLDLCILVLLAFGAQQLYKVQDQWRHLAASVIPLHVTNSGTSDINLYPADPAARLPVAVLPPKERLEYRYSGSSGKWVYVARQGRTVVIRGGTVELGIEVFGRFVSIGQFLALLVIVSIAGLISARRSRVQKRLLIRERQHAQLLEADKKVIASLQHEVVQLQSKLRDVAMQQQREMLAAEKQSRIHEATIAAQKAELERLGQAKLEAIKKYKEELSTNRHLLDEFRQRKNVEVQDLEQSLERVTREFEQLISDVRYYDVEYRDQKFESLLKGRQFEIAMARLFHDGFGCKILEWTPDKGTIFQLKTEQNGNPDLLLESPAGQRFAVECKFRSGYARDEAGAPLVPNLINWASRYQGLRYARYGRATSLNVYLAIGLFGEAVNPRVQLLVPLPMLFQKSEERRIYFSSGSSSKQLCVAYPDIEHLSIESESVAGLIPEMTLAHKAPPAALLRRSYEPS